EFLASKIPTIIECDIEITKDSVLMMMHDNSLDRTTTGKGKIIDQKWDEFKDVKLKDNAGTVTNFKVPTLEEVIKWGKNKVIYTLDVKRNTPYEKVVAMVQKLHAENYCVIITYDVNQAKKVYELDPNLMISVTIRDLKEYERHQQAGIPDKNMVAFIGTREPNKEFNEFLHKKGICTILGTLGNLDKMAIAKGDHIYKGFVNNGADILSTDRMIEAYEAIK
ncbi:MAG TPA: glycerophosphodiester phosphodiesterase family protein, partial [Emticicia sp.]